jgi:hypothetical protein
MRAPSRPLFLARRAYRRRRLIDAARLLPIAGLFLFLLPVFWHPADTPDADTARGGLYLFITWALLVLAAAILAHWIGHEEGEGDAPPPAGDGNGGGH